MQTGFLVDGMKSSARSVRSARKGILRLVIKKSNKEADLSSPIFIVRKVFLPILRSDMLISLIQC